MPATKPKPSLDMLVTEFLGSAGFDAILSNVQAAYVVPTAVMDERTRLYGPNVYDKMLLDEDVASALETRVLQACAERVSVQPAVGADPSNPEDIKNIYKRFVDRCLSGCGSMILLSREILSRALSHGSKVAEITYDYGVGEDAGRLMPMAVRSKSMEGFDYVVDTLTRDLIGVTPRWWLDQERQKLLNANIPPNTLGIITGLVPREKLLYFANNPSDGRVGGQSILSPAYLPWFMKTQVIPEFFKYLKKFGSPSIVGKLPKPADDPAVLADTSEDWLSETNSVERKKKLDVLKSELLKFTNATVLAVKGGTEIDLLKSEGNGEAYQFAMSYFGKQITVAILGSAQATTEANHESRSSKDVAQDVLGLRTMIDREGLAQMFTAWFRSMISINFGDAALIHAPFATLTKIEQQDRGEAIKIYSSAYAQGFIKDVQLEELYREVGLPELPDGYFEEQARLAEQLRVESGKLGNPAG